MRSEQPADHGIDDAIRKLPPEAAAPELGDGFLFVTGKARNQYLRDEPEPRRRRQIPRRKEPERMGGDAMQTPPADEITIANVRTQFATLVIEPD